MANSADPDKLFQKPTDLDLHCVQKQGISRFSRTRVNYCNKSTSSIIPAIAIICLCIKVIVAKISGKKMTEGQITILNQILIISMDR